MKLFRIVSFYSLTFCFTLLTSAQEKMPPPINSGEVLEDFYRLSEEEDYKAALVELNKVNQGDTAYADVLIQKVLCLINLEKYEEAIIVCDEGMALKPKVNFQSFWLNKGYIYSLQEKHQASKKEYKALLAEFPFFRKASNNLAYQYLELKEYDSSYAAFKEHARRYPMDDNGHFNLGVFAYNEGNLTEAFMALNMVILLKPNSGRALQVLKLLNELSNNTKTEKKNKEGFELESDEYADIDLLIENYVALDKKYKIDTKSEIYLAKQNHLIFSQLSGLEVTDYFFSEYYAPFYNKLMQEGWYDEMQHFELIPSGTEIHKKIVSKELDDIKEFNEWFRNEWYTRNNKINVNFENVSGKNTSWFLSDGSLEAIGSKDESTGELDGPMVYFFWNGEVKSKGEFVQGKRNGNWKYYREDGTIKQDVNYEMDKVVDSVLLYHKNGVIKERLFFKNEKRNGNFVEYYFDGSVYRKGIYKDGYFNGAVDYFFNNGNLEYKTVFSEGKLTGELTEMYTNGSVYRKEEFTEGESNGNYHLFWTDGSKRAVATKKDGLYVGEYKSYYENGKLSSKGSYEEGNKVGVWEEYYINGNLEKKGTYKNGNWEGDLVEYTFDGKLLAKKVFSEDYLLAYTYYDKDGNVLAEGGHKKKPYTVTNYYDHGVKSSEGSYTVNSGKNGTWKDYDKYGNLKTEYTNTDGKIDGETIFYYPWGGKKEVTNYKEGEIDGYSVFYYPNGQLKSHGYYINGDLAGVWEYYFPDGTLETTKYFTSDEIAGNRYNYAITGKPDYVERYANGYLSEATYFDTTGKVLNQFEFENGSGIYERNHFNGKTDFRGKYILSNSEGEYVWKSPAGKIETKGKYMEDRKEGKWEWYHENGKLSEEGNYVNNFKVGKWVEYFDDGQIDEVTNYKFGNLHGDNIQYYESGAIQIEGKYEYDELVGDYKFYDESGELQLARVYDNGVINKCYYLNESKEKVEIPVINGTAEVRGQYPNGKPSRQFNLKNGYFDGPYKTYYPNGNLSFEYELKYDERHGLFKSYYPNQKPEFIINYFYGYVHGLSTEYFDTGIKKKETNYRYGEKHGVETIFNEDGTVKKETMYYNDREV